MKSKLFVLSLSVLGMSFLSANDAVEVKAEKEVAVVEAKKEVAAEEIAKAKKAEESKTAPQDKQSCADCK
ncbi:MAG TPA: hypothetical protein VHK67_06830 [Rhabdochlamydiaceae bacterium]|jgi:hypothetical protein|nr:hypothetical protein [Rhabdochlamydiaceae bacterium]